MVREGLQRSGDRGPAISPMDSARPAPLMSRKGSHPSNNAIPPPAATLPSPPTREPPSPPKSDLAPASVPTPAPAPAPAPAPIEGTGAQAGMLAGRSSGVIDPDKWCALCERDGHDSVDCPLEDAF